MRASLDLVSHVFSHTHITRALSGTDSHACFRGPTPHNDTPAALSLSLVSVRPTVFARVPASPAHSLSRQHSPRPEVIAPGAAPLHEVLAALSDVASSEVQTCELLVAQPMARATL